MQYKALFLDLDGTTVTHLADKPSDRVSKAIHKVKKRLHVCVATGRPLKYARDLLTHLNLSGPCITNNGTQIFDPVADKVIKNVTIDLGVLPQIVLFTRAQRLKLYVNSPTGEVPYEQYRGGELLSLFLPELTAENVAKINKEFEKIPQIILHRTPSFTKELTAIEITSPLASKMHGINEISRMLKIKPAEIIGVGDGYNDFPLLMACGLKFAMGNAVPELKAIADFIGPSVENDGVAVIIEKFILPVLGYKTNRAKA